MSITYCPTAYCAPSQHAKPLHPQEVHELRTHVAEQNARQWAKDERSRQRGRHMSKFSPRNKKRT